MNTQSVVAMLWPFELSWGIALTTLTFVGDAKAQYVCVYIVNLFDFC